MSKYSTEEVYSFIEDWLNRNVEDRVKELEEPLREVWNNAWAGREHIIAKNDVNGFSELFEDYGRDEFIIVAEAACNGNWRKSAEYVQLLCDEGMWKLMGYDSVTECECGTFKNLLACYISDKWDKGEVDKFFKRDKWEYAETPSKHKRIEEYDMIVYKNGEPVGNIKVDKTYSIGISGAIECIVTIEGDHVDKEEGRLVIHSNYDKSPMEILNDFGYKEYEFKRK